MTEDNVEAAIQLIPPTLKKLRELHALWQKKKLRAFRQSLLLLNGMKSGDSTGLIALAENGDADADSLLRDPAAKSIEQGHGLPTELATYIAKFLRSGANNKKSKPGKTRSANSFRDSLILAVTMRVRKQGFEPARNVATKGAESACSIVTMALSEAGIYLTEAAANRIWSARRS